MMKAKNWINDWRNMRNSRDFCIAIDWLFESNFEAFY